MSPPTTPIERLAAGLAILAAHDGECSVHAVTIAGDTSLFVSVFVPVDDAADTALLALGWSDASGRWSFPL